MKKITADSEEWPKPIKDPLCNLISIALPILGSFAAYVIEDHHFADFKDQMVVQAISLFVSFLAGGILAIVAYCRSERYWGLTLLAFILNAPLPIVVILFITGTVEPVSRFFFPI